MDCPGYEPGAGWQRHLAALEPEPELVLGHRAVAVEVLSITLGKVHVVCVGCCWIVMLSVHFVWAMDMVASDPQWVWSWVGYKTNSGNLPRWVPHDGMTPSLETRWGAWTSVRRPCHPMEVAVTQVG